MSDDFEFEYEPSDPEVGIMSGYWYHKDCDADFDEDGEVTQDVVSVWTVIQEDGSKKVETTYLLTCPDCQHKATMVDCEIIPPELEI